MQRVKEIKFINRLYNIKSNSINHIMKNNYMNNFNRVNLKTGPNDKNTILHSHKKIDNTKFESTNKNTLLYSYKQFKNNKNTLLYSYKQFKNNKIWYLYLILKNLLTVIYFTPFVLAFVFIMTVGWLAVCLALIELYNIFNGKYS